MKGGAGGCRGVKGGHRVTQRMAQRCTENWVWWGHGFGDVVDLLICDFWGRGLW